MATIIATYMQNMSYETNIHVAILRTDYTQGYSKLLGNSTSEPKIRAKQRKISMLQFSLELFRIQKSTILSVWLKQEHEKLALTLNQQNRRACIVALSSLQVLPAQHLLLWDMGMKTALAYSNTL